MDKTHTPGPWKTNPKVMHQAVLGPDGYMVADCAIFGGIKAPTSERCTANGHLVSAAPDLLAALQGILREFTSEHIDSVSGTDVGTRANLAIAKALGQSK